MRLRTFFGLLFMTLLAAWVSANSVFAGQDEGHAHNQPAQQIASGQTDPISGAWDVSFMVNGDAHPATFDLKLERAKVTGAAFSEHTGPGTLREGGWWSEGTLSFTLDFKKHESIVIKGTLKEGKLVGEFTTEGFTSNWEATKKRAAIGCGYVERSRWDSIRYFVTESRLFDAFVDLLSAVAANTRTQTPETV